METGGLTNEALGATASKRPIKIRVSHLVKRFRSLLAIDDVSIEIEEGTFFAIVGPSGCGKTTLLRILGGLETQTSGEVEMRKGTSGRPQSSMIFQGDSIFPWMTVWDNAAYGLRMRKAARAEIEASVSHWLERTGLARCARLYPHQLSGGMRQRVSIARAFANNPEVLLMDEPFSALDEQNRTILHQELLRIWETDRKTVVFITHSVDEAVTLADRIMVMTASPGRAKSMIDITLERPRNVFELRNDPRYGRIVYGIWGHLKDEVQRARSEVHRPLVSEAG